MNKMLNKDSIVYIYGENLIKQCDRLPSFLNRASIVQDLINSYQLLKTNNSITVVESTDATEDELKLFHSSGYVEFLKKCNNCKDLEQCEEEASEFGLDYDCPLLENCFDLVKSIAGSSLSAAKLLVSERCKIAINWFGGWHHAQRENAEGFCYVNDVVIAIQKLTEKFDRILYLDLDIHHGDGVQNAFEYSNKILTLSFHKYAPGFYPGTGSLNDIGLFKGTYYSINVPLLEGISHETYIKMFTQIFPSVFKAFQPKALVIQCGADALNGDPIGGANLMLETYETCIKLVLDCNLPTLLLGGGGYNFSNTARFWTHITSLITNQKISEDIPDTCEFFTEYGPTYEMHIERGFQKDFNNEEYVNKVISTVLLYCQFIRRCMKTVSGLSSSIQNANSQEDNCENFDNFVS